MLLGGQPGAAGRAVRLGFQRRRRAGPEIPLERRAGRASAARRGRPRVGRRSCSARSARSSSPTTSAAAPRRQRLDLRPRTPGCAGAGPRPGSFRSSSLLPAFSLLYAYTRRTTSTPGRTRRGAPSRRSTGHLVNWNTHTLTFIPSIELRVFYRKPFGRVTPGLTSTRRLTSATVPIARSTEAYSFTSDCGRSREQPRRSDVAAVVGRAGPPGRWSFSRADLFGGLRESLKTDYMYSVEVTWRARSRGRLWKVSEVGVVASYFWSGLLGLDARPRLRP